MRKVSFVRLGASAAACALLGLGGCTPQTTTSQQAPASSPTAPPNVAAASTGSAAPTHSSGANSQAPEASKPVNAAPTRPQAPDSDVAAVAEGNNAFGVDLYRKLTQGNANNVIFSPLSVSAALAMTYAGAAGKTAEQMKTALHFTLPQKQLHPALGGLLFRLQPRDESKARGFTLRIANSLWLDKKFPLLESFTNTVTSNYGASTQLVDFAHNYEPARLTINEWVAKHTEDKIKDLLARGTIDDATRLVLVNAIYFHAQWLKQFSKDATSNRPFHTARGKVVKVPTMALQDHFSYARMDGAQVLRMSYRGPAHMLVILPDGGKFGQTEHKLNTTWLAKVDEKLRGETVDVQIPKFKLTPPTVSLKKILLQMGLANAFGAQADFSGMDGNKDLFLSGVYHKAFIEVDEKGTEAAAATAAVMALKSAPMPRKPKVFHADRPFLFLIRDNASGAILFAGRVMDPSGS